MGHNSAVVLCPGGRHCAGGRLPALCIEIPGKPTPDSLGLSDDDELNVAVRGYLHPGSDHGPGYDRTIPFTALRISPQH